MRIFVSNLIEGEPTLIINQVTIAPNQLGVTVTLNEPVPELIEVRPKNPSEPLQILTFQPSSEPFENDMNYEAVRSTLNSQEIVFNPLCPGPVKYAPKS